MTQLNKLCKNNENNLTKKKKKYAKEHNLKLYIS